jgi:hypothetical protein
MESVCQRLIEELWLVVNHSVIEEQDVAPKLHPDDSYHSAV